LFEARDLNITRTPSFNKSTYQSFSSDGFSIIPCFNIIIPIELIKPSLYTSHEEHEPPI
jgi:hypothetical protein